MNIFSKLEHMVDLTANEKIVVDYIKKSTRICKKECNEYFKRVLCFNINNLSFMR